MKVFIAIDSFKGSLTSLEAANAVKEGILEVNSNAEVIMQGVADGGEGTVDTLIEAMNGKKVAVQVKDPLLREIDTYFGIVNDTAIIEMASSSGLTLLSQTERNPLETSTYGVGQMIKKAIELGIRKFIIGIGGSATNDGGVGMLTALGFQFLDGHHHEILPGAQGLNQIEFIHTTNVLSELKECEFRIACDVSNPLCGKNGASYVYGSQKGASLKELEIMDQGMKHYALKTAQWIKKDYQNVEGSGAAGGLGFAFMSYLNASLVSGIDLVLDFVGLEDKIQDVDYVITGEGCLDKQTLMNKTPIGVARRAKKFNKPVIALAGQIKDDAYLLNQHGIDAMFSIVPAVISLDEALKKENAYYYLKQLVTQIFRLERLK